MKDTYFITGIGTDIGKTVVAAVITEALQADYWKPVQAGELDSSDTHTLKRWVTNSNTQFHESTYSLNTPMSPHAAAEIDGVKISASDIDRPSTKNHLVIEGAGGLLVPLNEKETVIDLIKPTDKVIVVSQYINSCHLFYDTFGGWMFVSIEDNSEDIQLSSFQGFNG